MQRSWIDRLERRFGEWGIPNLALFIVGMNAGIWVLTRAKPEFARLLPLEPALVFEGQVWRLFTFIFIPPRLSPLWLFFWLYLLYIYAQALENEWGEFRFNLFYGIGAAATAAVSLILGVGLSNVPLNTTIFLSFAALYPDFELLLFFILPVKVKWLAWLAWAGIAWGFAAGGWVTRLALAAGLLNYAVFFGRRHLEAIQHWLRVRRNRRRYWKAFKDD
ncbi:MAG: hypothetical protein ABII00_07655 [Elusimicrobiota bacterium]